MQVALKVEECEDEGNAISGVILLQHIDAECAEVDDWNVLSQGALSVQVTGIPAAEPPWPWCLGRRGTVSATLFDRSEVLVSHSQPLRVTRDVDER